MSEGGGIPDLSGILARVTENPQAMSMLASLLGGSSKQERHEEEPHIRGDGELLPALPPPKGQKSRRDEGRRRLLLALKPFLSKERCQVLETLLIVLDAISLLPRGKEPPCT